MNVQIVLRNNVEICLLNNIVKYTEWGHPINEFEN